VEIPDYDLPAPAIAQEPIEPRDGARLLVGLDPAGGLEHKRVADLPELLGICHRVAVMCDGELTGIVEGTEATQETVMTYAHKNRR